jgi:hypothetical protein
LLSLISLKNDLRLQQELNEGRINAYLEEVKLIINKGVYFCNNETWLKICECLAKIQYAYNISGFDICIREIYDGVMLEVADKNAAHNRLVELSGKNVNHNYCDIGFTYFYYMLFYKKYPHAAYEATMKAIIAGWKIFKFEYYGFTDDEVEKELSSGSYDFIY